MTGDSAETHEQADQMDAAMVDEFDSVAEWTAEIVMRLGPEHALPAACRGSGSPDALKWLAKQMRLGAGVRLLDVGAGVGGPAEFAVRTSGVSPTLAEPMIGACRASTRLFGLPVVVADGSALPFPDDSFEAAWSLGVLCTVTDKPHQLAELVRVVAPGGDVGLLVYERTSEQHVEQPAGNHFPSHDQLMDLLAAAGLEVRGTALIDDFEVAPPDWRAAVTRVDEAIADRYGDRSAWQSAQEQHDTIGLMIKRGIVGGRLLACRAARVAARTQEL